MDDNNHIFQVGDEVIRRNVSSGSDINPAIKRYKILGLRRIDDESHPGMEVNAYTLQNYHTLEIMPPIREDVLYPLYKVDESSIEEKNPDGGRRKSSRRKSHGRNLHGRISHGRNLHGRISRRCKSHGRKSRRCKSCKSYKY